MLPLPALAQSQEMLQAGPKDTTANILMVFATFVILSVILTRVWIGIMHHSHLHDEPLSDVEKRKRKPYLPSLQAIVITVICTIGLFLLSLKTVAGVAPFDGAGGSTSAAVLFGLIGLLSVASQYFWPRAKHFVFAFTIGTLVTFILIGFYRSIFTGTGTQDPFFLALGVVCVVLAWHFLFGPWRPQVKATVLATFVFWIALHMLASETPEARGARLVAAVVALIPAIIWCMLFLREHRQRLSLVILMFLAGMLSTAPILFYDAMVRHQIELQFFLFRVVPESFTNSSSAFVQGSFGLGTTIQTTLLSTLVAFLIVGCIEEVSKFWVLRRSGRSFFSSIDDVMQLGIIVAIGFAFAENVMNPSYFLAFVRQYLVMPVIPEWGGFMGNVLGRAILTNMVHILSTGVLAYFYGLALFADPMLHEEHKQGKEHLIPLVLHVVFRISEKSAYRAEKLILGFTLSFILHGLFNFLVTLPDLLPGNPRTIGDLVGASSGSPLHYIALLIIPSMFYVVGGFWVLSVLFAAKDNMKERGILVERDTFIDSERFFARLAK